MSRGLGSIAGDAILALHRRLLPRSAHIGWTPYLWLFYLISFLWKWFFVPVEPVEFTLTLITVAVFLRIYFDGYWHSGDRVLLNIAAILAIGVVWAPYNIGAMTFFIFAAAFVGHSARPRRGAYYLAGIVLVILAEWWLADLHWAFLLFGGAISILVGATNIYYAEVGRKSAALKLSQEEVRQLAAMAERERIARDLHDLLGHSLSVITIKAELAARLAERGDSRAEHEIREVERISRDALRQVREAVTGFRRAGLDGELANARLACEAAGVKLDIDRAEAGLQPEREAVLAMVLREAITNVIRHAGADRCTVSVRLDGRRVVLDVADDGSAVEMVEGAGITGMRERLAQIGGELEVDTQNGARLRAWVPIEDPPPAAGIGHRERTA